MKFLFADHLLDVDRRELRRGSDPVAVEPQVLDLLIYLMQNRDRVVSKDELIASIWGGRIVSESNLSSRIYAARKAVGDSGRAPRLIRTVARKGLRFVGEVHTQLNGAESAAHATESQQSRSHEQAHEALPQPDRPAVAVLPFTNMSGDSDQEYFADGMVEEITAALSRVKSFFVIARNTSFTYKGKAVDVKQVGRELGIRYVLDGSVRKAQNHVRITAQLIDATTGNHIWSDRYDGSIEDVFDLQDRITESVVGAIHPSILLAEIERTKRKRPESLDAYDCVLRAFPHVWALDPAANALAIDHLNRAIEIEPDYPLALSLSAWCQAQKAIYQWTLFSDEAKAEALRLAKLAGGMNNDDPMVLTMLCAAHTVVGDLDIASALIEKALALDPNSAIAWNRSGWVNHYFMRPEVAIEQFQRAMRLSPFDPMNFNAYIGIGAAHFVAGRYADTALWIEKGLIDRPGATWAYRELVAAYALLGRDADARAGLARLLKEYRDLTVSKVLSALVYSEPTLDRIAEGLRKAGLPEE